MCLIEALQIPIPVHWIQVALFAVDWGRESAPISTSFADRDFAFVGRPTHPASDLRCLVHPDIGVRVFSQSVF